MKQGLSLRVSQHLALTPQLQQSIRLLQLSTLELSQEVEQMLDDNPFLELNTDEAPREEFGLAQADAPVRDDDREAEFVAEPMAALPPTESTSTTAEAEAPATAEADEPTWDGDGTTEMVPDDGEWGGDAPARKNNLGDDGEMDATELARGQESLQQHLHRQALALRLSAEDSAALRFLIESLNDDGYLEDSLEELAIGLAGRDEEQLDELVHRFTVALRLLHHLEPAGVGARTLGECLTLQLRALQDGADAPAACATALRLCAQPMELLARRDVKRLAQACGDSEADVKAAIALITRLEPKPGRRFVDVERNIVVPDVIVTRIGRAAQPKFRVQLNSDVMPRLRVHDIYAGALNEEERRHGRHRPDGPRHRQQHVRHGHSLAVLEHPATSRWTALKAAGARGPSPAPRSWRARSDVVILVLTGSPQVEAVLTGPGGVLRACARARVVIDCSTAIPSSTLRMAQAVQAAGRPLPGHADDAHAQGGRRGPAEPAGGRRCRAAGRMPAAAAVFCREHHPCRPGGRGPQHEAAAQLCVAGHGHAAGRGRRLRRSTTAWRPRCSSTCWPRAVAAARRWSA
jgi:RNA polymerase sigma-54 factor